MNSVFNAVLKDSDWWHTEVYRPGLLVAARVANLGSFIDTDASVGSKTPSGPASSSTSPSQTHPASSGGLATNRQGRRLCAAFNNGGCSPCGGNNICPEDPNARHQCSKCLRPGHTALQCSNKAVGASKNNGGNKRNFGNKNKNKGGKRKQ